MKPLILIAIISLISPFAIANELSNLSKKFVVAATNGDRETLKKLYLDSPTLQKTIEALSQELPKIKENKLSISHIPRELIIGELGVSLMKIKSEDPLRSRYLPIIFVRTETGWKIFPWSSEADIKVLFDQRSPEEQIHLKLFNKWANLTENQLEKMQNKAQ